MQTIETRKIRSKKALRDAMATVRSVSARMAPSPHERAFLRSIDGE